jgi:hypothetical protein
MHKEWYGALMEHRDCAIVAPRGHAKTTLVSIAYVLWRIGNNPNLRIKIVTQSDDMAKDILTAVSNIILNEPRYKEVFPNLTPAKHRYWTKEKIYVERTKIGYRDASVEACGVTTSGAGGRTDVLICDDLNDNRNTSTPGLRKNVKDAFYNVWLNTLEPGTGQMVYIGTIWHRDDLTSELIKNPDYHVLFYAIDQDFTPLWPHMWPTEKLKEVARKRGMYAFNRGFRNLPATDADFTFPPEVIKACVDESWRISSIEDFALDRALGLKPPNEADAPAPMRYYTGVDLAIGKTKEAAFSVIFTLGVSELGVKHPVEIKRGRWSSPETARNIIESYERFKPEVVMVETNQYQKALIDWMQELSKIPLQSYYTTVNKHDEDIGINSLVVEMENLMWRFPSVSHDGDCQCSWCSWFREMEDHPHGKFSDCVMAMWLCREAYRISTKQASSGRFSVWTY